MMLSILERVNYFPVLVRCS